MPPETSPLCYAARRFPDPKPTAAPPGETDKLARSLLAATNTEISEIAKSIQVN